MATVTETITQAIPILSLRGTSDGTEQAQGEPPYRYARLLPHFSPATYPPLTPFEHQDPGSRALQHSNPRSFLQGAESVVELTPRLGTEIRGVNLAQLDAAGRDQLALEVRVTSLDLNKRIFLISCKVARRGLVVFRDQQEFIDQGPDSYLEWGRHFGRYGYF